MSLSAFSFLEKLLKQYPLYVLRRNLKGDAVRLVAMVDTFPTAINKGTVYIVDSLCCKELFHYGVPSFVICCGPSPDIDKLDPSESCIVLYTGRDKNAPSKQKLYGFILELLKASEDENDNLPTQFLNCDTIDKTISLCSIYLNNPVILTSVNHKIITTSGTIALLTPDWQSIVRTKNFSLASVYTLRWRNSSDESRYSDQPVILERNTKLQERYSVILKVFTYKDRILGHLIVVGLNAPFSREDIKKVQFFSRLMYKQLINKVSLTSPKAGLTSIIADLLDNSHLSDHTISGMLSQHNWHPGPLIYLLCLPTNCARAGTLIPELQNISLSPQDQILVYRNFPVIILSRKKPLYKSELSDDSVIHFLTEHHIPVGVSRWTDTLFSLTTLFFQARFAVDRGGNYVDAENQVYFYDDVWIYDLFDNCKNLNVLQSVCSPTVRDLIRYDKSHTGDLVATLTEYLHCNRHLIDTSQKMLLHRNTVKYRILKCQEILQMDLKNADEAEAVMLSLKIIKYLELYRKEHEPIDPQDSQSGKHIF